MLSSVGIVSGRDDFCFSKDSTTASLHELKNNIQRFISLDCENARTEFNLGKDSRDWQIQLVKKKLESFDSNNFIQVNYSLAPKTHSSFSLL